MVENFEIRGEWFYPDNPSNSIRGKLIYNVLTGMTLDLEGSYSNSDFSLPDIDILYGDTEKGKFTLFNIFCTQIKRGSSVYFQSFYVNIAYKGIYAKNLLDADFYEAKFQYYGMQSYFKTSGIKLTSKDDPNNWNIQYQKPPVISAETNDGKIEISFVGRYNFGRIDEGKESKSVSLSEELEVKYTFRSPKSMIDAKSQSDSLASLFSLLSGNVVFTSNILLNSVSDEEPVIVYFKNQYLRNTYKNHRKQHVPIESIQDLPTLISTWFSRVNSFRSVLNLREQAILNYEQFNENRFLDAVTVLETFHRKFFNQDITQDQTITDTIASIFESGLITDEYKDFFKKRLAPQSQKSLLQRLLDIFHSLNKVAKNLISDDFEDLAKRIRDTRNSYTHNSGRKRKSVLRLTEMADSTINCEKLLEYMILKELGVEEDMLSKQFAKHRIFKKNP